MSKAEKASEPTMDEILASIRKIIAEEPAGARKAGDGGGWDEGEKRAHPAPRATLDDILGMADSKPSADRPAELRAEGFSWPPPGGTSSGAAGAGRAPSERERPVFPAPNNARSQAAVASDGAREASQRPGDLGTIIPRRPGDHGGDAPSDRTPTAGRLPDWLSRPTPLQPSVANEVPPPTLPGELHRMAPSGPPAGSQVTASGEDRTVLAPPAPPSVEANVAKDTARSPQIPAPKPDGGTAAKSMPKAASGPLDVAEPVSAKPIGAGKERSAIATPQTSAPTSQSGAAAPAMPPSASDRSVGDGKATVPAQPAKAAPASPQEKAAAASAVGGAPAPQTKDAALPGNSLPTAKTATAVGSGPAAGAGAPAKANGPGPAGGAAKPAEPAVSGRAIEQEAGKAVAAAPTAESEKAAVPPAANGKGDRTAPVPVAEPATAVAKPAVMTDKAKVAKVGAAELVAAAAGSGVRTLDDTIIELLRPMIRQWLDDNMPRMVEKALRIELAASLQAKGEATKGDASKH